MERGRSGGSGKRGEEEGPVLGKWDEELEEDGRGEEGGCRQEGIGMEGGETEEEEEEGGIAASAGRAEELEEDEGREEGIPTPGGE